MGKTDLNIYNKDFFDKNFSLGKKFDFIYLDPPYRKFLIDDLVERLERLNVLKTNSLIILESSLKEVSISGLKLLDSRRIGKTFISFASADIFISPKDTATKPVKFSKLASNSCLNVR